MLAQTTSKRQRPKISPDNPVRRRLFAVDDLNEEARNDNFVNIFQESAARDRVEKMRKWNFDFENEVPLDGIYQWYPCDTNEWVGINKHCDDDAGEEESFLPMKKENEATPKSKCEEVRSLLRIKRKNSVNIGGYKDVKRKIHFE